MWLKRTPVAADPFRLLMAFNNNQLRSSKYCDAAEWAAIQDVLTNLTAYVPPTTAS
jgi:hypothetical protein